MQSARNSLQSALIDSTMMIAGMCNVSYCSFFQSHLTDNKKLVILRGFSLSFITKEDIVDFLGENIPQSYIDDIMTEADENNDKKISYDEFLALWGEETDRQMAEDREDVKDRRHRRNDSGATGSSFLSDFSDDDGVFDQLAINPASFERDEIAKMLDAPDTPGCRERRVSGTNAFKLEKERSMRAVSARDESRQGSSTQISHYDVPGELSKRNEG